MQTPDRQQFAALMQRLAEAFDKPLTDSLVNSYWEALKDQQFASVQRRAEQALKTSKFFPRPHQLRPADEKPMQDSAGNEPLELERMNREAKESWDRIIAQDPEEGRIKLRLARASRIEATTHPSHPAHEEAADEGRRAQAALFKLWDARRAAVPRGTSPAQPAPLAEIAEKLREEFA